MKKNKGGFFMVMVLIISLMMMLFGVIVYMIISNDYYFLDDGILSRKIIQNKTNSQNMTLKFYDETNSDGDNIDNMSCSGGIINFSKDINNTSPICSGDWGFKEDGINDKGNNDDYLPTFYSTGVDSKLDFGGRIFDNDDYARKYLIGIIAPEELKTVLFINDNLINSINSDKNNNINSIPTKIPRDIQSLNIKLGLNNINGKIKVYRIDKNIFNTSKDIKVISETDGDIKNINGYINDSGDIDTSGNPYIFDIHNYDYAVNLENTSNETILSYELKAISDKGDEVYIVGLNEGN